MTTSPSAPTTRSAKLFNTAFALACEHQHRRSDEHLELAHEMRELELRLSHIAEQAPSELSLLLVKATMSGFSEGDDPSAYLSANSEPIQFYAENDAQLRALIKATFDPAPYKRDEVRLTEAELIVARQALAARISEAPDIAQVSDPVITPASTAMMSRGFKPFSHPGGSTILRECPDCKGKYSTKMHFKRRIYWHCPHCNLTKEA